MLLTLLCCWIPAFVLAAAHAVISAFYFLCAIDYEDDEISSIELTKQVNPIIMVEYGSHLVLTIIFAFFFKWIMLIINIPILAYHIKLFMDKEWKLDATDVFKKIKQFKNMAKIKLGVYCVLFLVYFGSMIHDIVKMAGDD